MIEATSDTPEESACIDCRKLTAITLESVDLIVGYSADIMKDRVVVIVDRSKVIFESIRNGNILWILQDLFVIFSSIHSA